MRGRAWLLVGAILLGAAALATLLDAGVGAPARPLVVLVLDASASVRRTRPAWREFARAAIERTAREAAEAGAELAVVSCAAYVARIAGPGAPEAVRADAVRAEAVELDPPPDRDLESRLAGALALAQGMLADRGGRVVLASDGAATDGDPRPLVRALADSGCAVTSLPLDPPALADLALAELALPREVEPGAPLSARLELRLAPGRGAPPATADAEIELRSPAGVRNVHRQFALDPALARREGAALVFDVDIALGRAEAGVLRVRARAMPAGGDPIPEDDTREGAVVCGDALRVVACTTAEARAAPPLSSLAGFEVVRVEADALAPALADADLLVTRDVDARELPAAALAAWLRSGGAWLDLPGERTLAGWRSRAEAAALLPLQPAPRGPRERTVELLVDASGSMSGPASAAVLAAAIELARLAPPEDDVELRFFTDRLEAPFVLSASDPDGRTSAARRLLEARAPSGPTRIVAALAALAAERAAAKDDALVLLLSDGREESGTTAADAGRAREALAATRARLSVFALGPDPDLDFLAALCAPGEAPARAAEAAELVRLFLRESARDDVLAGAPLALHARPASAFDAGGAAAAIARATEDAPLPDVARLARTVAAPAAQVLWLAADPELPALALQAIGAGHSAAFAGLAADGAVAGPEWDLAFAPAARTLARLRRERAAAQPRATWRDGRVELENVPADWPPILEAHLAPAGADGAGGGRTLALAVPAVGAGVDPRSLRTSGPAPELALELAGRLCELRPDLGGAPDGTPALWLGFPPAPEFRPAVELGLAPAGAPRTAVAGPGGHPLAPWFLLAGLVCTGVGLWTASEPRGARARQAERSSGR